MGYIEPPFISSLSVVALLVLPLVVEYNNELILLLLPMIFGSDRTDKDMAELQASMHVKIQNIEIATNICTRRRVPDSMTDWFTTKLFSQNACW